MSFGEEWRPVVGFEEFLAVSSMGRVRSLDRLTRVSAGPRCDPYFRTHKGKILKPSRHPAGYVYVNFSAGGEQRTAKVHHLVLEAFVGPRPDGMVACHYNDIPNDNRVGNLRWDTRESNDRDRVENGHRRLTHCKRGHEFTPENTMQLKNPPGARRCRACQRGYQKGRK